MAQVTQISRNLQAIKSDGTIVPPDENGYVTLGVATYYFVLGGIKDEPLASCHILTDATIAGTFTVEGSGLPRQKGGGGAADVTDWSTTTGEWVQINPPSGTYVPSNGTGWTVTGLSLAKTAGVGAALLDIGNIGQPRLRIAAAITTGGKVRVSFTGKS